MRNNRWSRLWRDLPLFAVIVILFAGCQQDTAELNLEETLYVRLGGRPAIEAVVADFLNNVTADTLIDSFFVDVDPVKFQSLLVQQICEISEGPCLYSGRSMTMVHRDMKISDVHFDALIADLTRSLNTFNVPQKEQNELLSALGLLRENIVTHPADTYNR